MGGYQAALTHHAPANHAAPAYQAAPEPGQTTPLWVDDFKPAPGAARMHQNLQSQQQQLDYSSNMNVQSQQPWQPAADNASTLSHVQFADPVQYPRPRIENKPSRAEGEQRRLAETRTLDATATKGTDSSLELTVILIALMCLLYAFFAHRLRCRGLKQRDSIKKIPTA